MKKVLVLLLLAVLIAVPVFATETGLKTTGDGDAALDLGFIKRAVNLIVGIFAGGYCLAKFALDLFHAIRNSDQDPNGIKKAIGSMLLNAAILVAFFFILNTVFPSTASTTGQGKDGFLAGLSGALVHFNLL